MARGTRNVGPVEMDSREDPFWKQALRVFAGCVVLYFVGFAAVQWWRERQGPWEVTFGVEPDGLPQVEISQPKLGIHDVTLVFTTTNVPLRSEKVTVQFDGPTKADAIPFGEVKFFDTTFLPGTLTMDLFGHEIELLPRTMIIDKAERPWRRGDRVELGATNGQTFVRHDTNVGSASLP